ncbi:MAG: DNA mismatch repair protein MutS, partial [Ferruginibacter sp.]
MEIDKTTLNDLAIFNTEEEFSVFNKLNCTLTIRGKEQLKKNLNTPLATVQAINGVQQSLQLIIKKSALWPAQISNGTIMVIERFYDAVIDPIPAAPSSATAYSYKLLHGPDFSLVRFSVTHCFDFIKGMQQMVNIFSKEEKPGPLQNVLAEIEKIVFKENFNVIKQYKKAADMPLPQMLQFAAYARYQYKINMLSLLSLHARLDAWYGMAMAVNKYGLVFPEFIESEQPVINAAGLYHILLPQPVAYDICLDRQTNFLFLTGANMAGKSTFIKSVGSAVFLAHLGMGVPAKKMKLSLFDGLLSNINVIDNIAKGESYFFNEVQRVKATISKINDGRKWLILIDELFKGTNVQDAMKCSTSVIEGLLKVKNSLFILSTHLYEIGDDLKKYTNISFNYFETTVKDDQLSFSYQLKEGISNDRLGYLILKKEGVV